MVERTVGKLPRAKHAEVPLVIGSESMTELISGISSSEG